MDECNDIKPVEEVAHDPTAEETEFIKFVTQASDELEKCRAIVSRPSEGLTILNNPLSLLHIWKQLEQITDHSLNLLAVEYAGRGRRAGAVGVAGIH